MTDFEKEDFVTYPRVGSVYKILPNYDENGEREKDFFETFYFNVGDRIIFDDPEDSMSNDLQLDLYQFGYLNKITVCYVAEYTEYSEKPILKILILGYTMLRKLAEDKRFYYDISEYPRIRIISEDKDLTYATELEEEFNIDEKIDIDSLYDFENEEEIINFVKEKEFTIEEKLSENSWFNNPDVVKQLFDVDPRLKKYDTIFRIRKINNILDE
jgi:uncharacterized pyridoxamine 5'-phosphate oxidase family protein